ncbi:hypothetical protein Tco_0757512 [Tanacetum coccineum]
MTESPLMDSSFAVLVFSLGDDPIACIHKAMAFLTAVAINPDYPEQTIMIGSTLTKEGQNKLCDLLQRFHPVRQNRRSQAANRNHAIQEEVEKLVDAGIMKEVHYHSWLSNLLSVTGNRLEGGIPLQISL